MPCPSWKILASQRVGGLYQFHWWLCLEVVPGKINIWMSWFQIDKVLLQNKTILPVSECEGSNMLKQTTFYKTLQYLRCCRDKVFRSTLLSFNILGLPKVCISELRSPLLNTLFPFSVERSNLLDADLRNFLADCRSSTSEEISDCWTLLTADNLSLCFWQRESKLFLCRSEEVWTVFILTLVGVLDRTQISLTLSMEAGDIRPGVEEASLLALLSLWLRSLGAPASRSGILHPPSVDLPVTRLPCSSRICLHLSQRSCSSASAASWRRMKASSDKSSHSSSRLLPDFSLGTSILRQLGRKISFFGFLIKFTSCNMISPSGLLSFCSFFSVLSRLFFFTFLAVDDIFDVAWLMVGWRFRYYNMIMWLDDFNTTSCIWGLVQW